MCHVHVQAFDAIDDHGSHELLLGTQIMPAFTRYLLSQRRINRLVECLVRHGSVADAAAVANAYLGNTTSDPHALDGLRQFLEGNTGVDSVALLRMLPVV